MKKRQHQDGQGGAVKLGESATFKEVLAAALRHHQAGRLVEAEKLYRRVLQIDSRHADSLHLLGVVASQKGRHDLAVDLISKAIGINNKTVSYHFNLGLALRALGRFDAAAGCLRAAAHLRPDVPETHAGLGDVLKAQGKLNEAVDCYRVALDLKPDFPELHNNLGNALRDQGKLEEAEVHFRKAIALKPNYMEAHYNLGNTLRDQRNLDEAIACYRRALAIKPEQAEVLVNLGNALQVLGELDEAIVCYRRALNLKPNQPGTLLNLGAALRRQHKLNDALACFRKVLELKPDYADAHNNLGLVLRDMGLSEEAMASHRRAIELKADYAEAFNNLGLVLQEQGEVDEAVANYCHALSLKPDSCEILNNWGDALRTKGRFADAIAKHEEALLLGTDPCTSFYGVSQCRKFTGADSQLIADMQALLATAGFSAAKRSLLHFALGKIFDDLAEYEIAIQHFDEANRLEHETHNFDRADFSLRIKLLIDAFPKEALENPIASGSELPLFIVGMPRSGTTLTEQILASHDEVAPGGELNFWLKKLDRIRKPLSGQSDSAADQAMISDYLSILTGISNVTARVTDKMPYNFLFLGLLHRLLPKARIIHCRRNPVDTALSIYFTRFGRGHEFAYSRREIVFYYREYARIMDHWRAILPPDRFIEIAYEDLISDQEAASRRLVEFCGLEWSQACLDFHKKDRSIITASAWQARQPIYRTSAERWRRYEPWLGEFRELL